MYPFNRHNRLREDLSAYIDGRLSARDTAAVESHLASCGTCPAELEGLRLASQALRGLPAVEAPRSFALTPEMAGATARPRVTSYPALNAGMRLSAAGLAVALAAVMFVDLDGNGGGSRDDAASLMESAENFDAGGGTGLTANDDSRADYGADAGGAAAPAATGVPAEGFAPAASPVPPGEADGGDAVESQLEPSAASEGPSSDHWYGTDDIDEKATLGLENSDADGISTQAVVEVVLAALLGSAIGGAVLVTVAERRRLP